MSSSLVNFGQSIGRFRLCLVFWSRGLDFKVLIPAFKGILNDPDLV